MTTVYTNGTERNLGLSFFGVARRRDLVFIVFISLRWAEAESSMAELLQLHCEEAVIQNFNTTLLLVSSKYCLRVLD
jgi:hypothetical protein